MHIFSTLLMWEAGMWQLLEGCLAFLLALATSAHSSAPHPSAEDSNLGKLPETMYPGFRVRIPCCFVVCFSKESLSYFTVSIFLSNMLLNNEEKKYTF